MGGGGFVVGVDGGDGGGRGRGGEIFVFVFEVVEVAGGCVARAWGESAVGCGVCCGVF